MPGKNVAGPDAAEAARLATVGRLTRGALHELGNPLVALIGTAELAAAGAEADSQLRQRLDLIAATANEIADIVRALQRVARVGGTDELERIEVATEAAAALALVQRLSPDLHYELEGTYPVDAAVVETRPGALLLALVSLLLDALESAPPGTVRLTVSRAEGSVSVSVAGARANEDARILAAAAGAVLEEGGEGAALVLC